MECFDLIYKVHILFNIILRKNCKNIPTVLPWLHIWLWEQFAQKGTGIFHMRSKDPFINNVWGKWLLFLSERIKKITQFLLSAEWNQEKFSILRLYFLCIKRSLWYVFVAHTTTRMWNFCHLHAVSDYKKRSYKKQCWSLAKI